MRRFVVFVASAVAVAALVSACSSGGLVAGRSADLSPSASLSSSPSASVQATQSTAAPSPQVSTVTVLPSSPAPQENVVTRTVQAPPAYTPPATSSSLTDLYAQASEVDGYSYYDGSAMVFDSPSQNIACYVYAYSVQCSIHHYDFPQPGPDCDAGIAATVDSSGSPSLTDCSGYFTASGAGATLPYGYSISNGSFACVSESSGVSCMDLDTDTGFTLSRAAYSPVSY